MPRVLRKAKRRSAGYTEEHVRQMLNGFGLIDDPFGYDDSFDESAARTAWQIMREKLLADWIRERPGSRPWIWWRLESVGRRERTDGIQHPFDDRLRKARFEKMPQHYWARRHANDLYFGCPRLIFTKQEVMAEYESEAVYLRRHGLLTQAETTELFP